MKTTELRIIDIRDPDESVEVILSSDQKTLWVNVDSLCVLRIQVSSPRTAIPLITEGIAGDKQR